MSCSTIRAAVGQSFSQRWNRLFWEGLFSEASQVLQKWTYNLLIASHITLKSLVIFLLRSAVLGNEGKKNKANFVLNGELASLSTPKEMIIELQRQLSKNLVKPGKLFPDVRHKVCFTRWYKKVGQKYFCSGKVAFSSKIGVSKPVQVLQKWSYNLHKVCQNDFWAVKKVTYVCHSG